MTRVKEAAEGKKKLLRTLFYPLHIKIPIEAMASLMIAVLAWYIYQEVPLEMKVRQQAPGSVQTFQQGPGPKTEEKSNSVAAPPSPAGKVVVWQIRGRDPESKSEAQRNGALKEKRKEEMGHQAKSAGVPVTDEKKADAADRQEDDKSPAIFMKKPEPVKVQPVPTPPVRATPREVEQLLSEEVGAKRQKLEAAKDRAPAMGKASLVLRPPVFTLKVKEVGQAAEAVQALLQQVQAENVLEETRPDRKVFSADVGEQRIEKLYNQLKAVGEVKSSTYPRPATGKAVLIRIEIFPMRESND